jgi:hypothetical protein
VGGGVRALRAAVAALRANAYRVPGLRSDATPADYLGARAVFDLVDFAATLTPGWMDRGRVWRRTWRPRPGSGCPPGSARRSR